MSGLAVAVAALFYPTKAMAAAKQGAGDWTSPGLAAPEVNGRVPTDGKLQYLQAHVAVCAGPCTAKVQEDRVWNQDPGMVALL
jgi:hypothetical protein